MRVLLIGATGFIGRHVCARLLVGGVAVVAAVREPARATRRFPGIATAPVDLNRMTAASDWRPLLAGIDAVVNCAGVLQSGRGQSARAIHTDAPAALFAACAGAGVRRVVQVSAVSAVAAAGTEYALTKLAADDLLRASDLDWVVLRPSLAYGGGSFGGTSALRGLAGLPYVLPTIGDGGQLVQPVHVDDIAETVWRCLEPQVPVRRTLDVVGPDTMTLREVALRLRDWLDLPAVRTVAVPMPLVRVAAWVGDRLGAGPIRSTSIRQLAIGNVSDAAAFARAIGFAPRGMAAALRAAPSHVQDRWHARLYFLRPLLSVSLVLLWLGSGVAGLANPPGDAVAIAARLGLPGAMAGMAPVAFCLVDLVFALLVAGGWRPRVAGALQIGLIGLYTLGLTWAAPGLWLDPYGALLKNLPILVAIAVWMALEDDR